MARTFKFLPHSHCARSLKLCPPTMTVVLTGVRRSLTPPFSLFVLWDGPAVDTCPRHTATTNNSPSDKNKEKTDLRECALALLGRNKKKRTQQVWKQESRSRISYRRLLCAGSCLMHPPCPIAVKCFPQTTEWLFIP